MNSTYKKYVTEMLHTEDEHLKKLHDIVNQSLQQENSILQNLTDAANDNLSPGQVVADKVAKFGGSWKFIILFSIVLAIWILINIFLPKEKQFDPFPFILMNLVLSCIAALQAPIIMMSQNRQEEKDRKRNENDYLVNLKAEIEIRTLHQKMDLLIQEQFKKLMETQAEQIRLIMKLTDDKNKKHQ